MIKKGFYIFLISVLCSLLSECKTRNEGKNQAEDAVPVKIDEITQLSEMTIHEASYNGQAEQVKKLLDNGSDPDSTDQEGRTALMYASFSGYADIIKILIEKDADVNLCDNYGRTALMMASSGPYPEAVKVLLDNRADPDIADSGEHFTALMYASAEGQTEVVKLLLAFNANPFLKDADGDDAAVFAMNNGHRKIAELLESYSNILSQGKR
jgi:ankyrin repeat protein